MMKKKNIKKRSKDLFTLPSPSIFQTGDKIVILPLGFIPLGYVSLKDWK